MTPADDQGESFRVYWQPGCSSCLQAKEFLTRHGIPFKSINVMSCSGGLAELRELGARSVPVVSKGTKFVAAQNLDELAAFLGVRRDHTPLTVAALSERLMDLLGHSAAQLEHLSDSSLGVELRPGRTVKALSFHLFCIAEGFLAAADGGCLTIEYCNRVPDADTSKDGLTTYAGQVSDDVARWRQSLEDGSPVRDSLETYYGSQTLLALLERTCWHIGQHLRQLEEVLSRVDPRSVVPLKDALLDGLPLPDHVWDDEVELNVESKGSL